MGRAATSICDVSTANARVNTNLDHSPQVGSDTSKKIFLAASSVCAVLATITSVATAFTENGYKKVGYPIYFTCTVSFVICMMLEVLYLKSGTKKMRSSLAVATFAACFNGLLPDLIPGSNMYFTSRWAPESHEATSSEIILKLWNL